MKTNSSVDISGFNRGLTGFVDKLGLEAPRVLKKEMGELIKTLIKITPPRYPSSVREHIDRDVKKKFFSLDIETEFGHTMETGSIRWYRVTKQFLFGVAADKDMRKASVDKLKPLYYRIKNIQSRQRQILPFKHPHKSQQVAILQNIFTKRSTVRSLISQIQKNVGRLKAGWLVAWDHLGPTGGNQPPAWVMRHQRGARGYFIDGLGVKNYPTFTIANTAVGVGNPRLNLNALVRQALAIRAKAMQTNLLLFMRGKKNLSDYARA